MSLVRAIASHEADWEYLVDRQLRTCCLRGKGQKGCCRLSLCVFAASSLSAVTIQDTFADLLVHSHSLPVSHSIVIGAHHPQTSNSLRNFD